MMTATVVMEGGKATMKDKDVEQIFLDAQTGKGSRMLSTAELEFLIPIILDRSMFIPAMESYQRRSEERWQLRMDLSIFWEKPATIEQEKADKAQAPIVVQEILNQINKEGKEMAIQIWLDDL